ncbi:MAG: sensor histidine kinase [Polyangiaceae bacterium]|nr:sensor histidine kinase [Polyangiaceae bacterium]
MPRLSTRFLNLFYPWRVREAMAPETARAFQDQCRTRLRYDGRLMQGVIFACDLLWWPFDYLVFWNFQWRVQALVWPRIAIGITALVYLLLAKLRVVDKAPFASLVIVALLQALAAGFGPGSLGGPETPYLHALYIVVFASVPFPFTPRQRILFNGVVTVGLIGGYLAVNRGYIHSPHMAWAVSFFTLSNFLSLSFGHGKFILDRDNFVQAQKLTEQAQLLESRVAERTVELRDLLDGVETARERERRRISRELHDELGQELSALRYSLQFTRVRYDREPSAIAANLQDLEELLRRTAQTTRNLVTELRPRVLDDLGLEAAVEWLVKRVESRSDLKCTLTSDGDLSGLDERASITAFRVIQEALTNVVRHAQATVAHVNLAAGDSTLTITVEDDGVGLHGESGPRSQPSTGVGLLGMRERVHALSGTFQVGDGKDGKGVRIECRLPLAPPPSLRHPARSS